MHLKKAQISLEMLIVISILLIGAMIFTVFYLQSFKDRSQDITFGTTEIGFIYEDEDPVNVIPPETVYTFEDLTLSLIPPIESEINAEFGIAVKVSNVENYTSVKIKQVKITEYGYLTTNCRLKDHPNNHTYSDVGYLQSSGASSFEGIIYFICDDPGTFNFTISVVPMLNGQENTNILSSSISKTIKESVTPPPVFTFSDLDLSLIDPNGDSLVNTVFGIDVKVLNVEGYHSGKISSVSIKKDETYTNDCKLEGKDYSYNYLDVDFLYLNGENLENKIYFSCKEEGEYNFEITVTDEKEENPLSSDILKEINPINTNNCTQFTGDLFFNYPNNNVFNNDVEEITISYKNDPNCIGNIYYTTNETEPNETSFSYTSFFPLYGNTPSRNYIKIKAIVIGEDFYGQKIYSGIKEVNYIFKTNIEPMIPKSIIFSQRIYVTLRSNTTGATIYYTDDGRTPDISSIKYTSPIFVDSDTTIKARAFKNNYLPSDIEIEEYTQEPTQTECMLSGNGTSSSPYKIHTPFDLYCVNEKLEERYPEAYTGETYTGTHTGLLHFKLMNDLNLNHNLLKTKDWYSEEYGFPSLGYFYKEQEIEHAYDFGFLGIFDGGNHTIYDLNINRKFTTNYLENVNLCNGYGDCGEYNFVYRRASTLFGDLLFDSNINNLNIDNATVLSELNSITGILTNASSSSTYIFNVNITNSKIMCLCAEYACIDNSESQPIILSPTTIGGLVGYSAGNIMRSSFDGNIYVPNDKISIAGGLIGIFKGPILSESYSKGTITVKSNTIHNDIGFGGFIGKYDSNISSYQVANNYSFVNINIMNNESNLDLEKINRIIYRSGGFVGVGKTHSHNTAYIFKNNYSTGKITFNYCETPGNCSSEVVSTGGFSGEKFFNLTSINSFWDILTSDTTTGYRGEGKITSFFKDVSARLRAVDVFNVGITPYIWGLNSSINNGYPYLINNH